MATKKCPFCAEEIDIEAVKCKHCGELLTKEAKKDHHKGNQSALVTTLVVLAIIALILIITGV